MKTLDEKRQIIAGYGWTLLKQLKELQEHGANGQVEKAANEFADIATLAWEGIQQLEYEPDSAVYQRVVSRYKGNTREIVERYNREFMAELERRRKITVSPDKPSSQTPK